MRGSAWLSRFLCADLSRIDPCAQRYALAALVPCNARMDECGRYRRSTVARLLTVY